MLDMRHTQIWLDKNQFSSTCLVPINIKENMNASAASQKTRRNCTVEDTREKILGNQNGGQLLNVRKSKILETHVIFYKVN